MSQPSAMATPAAMPQQMFGMGARALRAAGNLPETPDTGSPSPALPRSMAGRAPLLRGRASSVFLVSPRRSARADVHTVGSLTVALWHRLGSSLHSTFASKLTEGNTLLLCTD